MAADSDDIILSISADVAALRRAQTRIESAIGSAAKSADKSLSGIAKSADKNFKSIEDSARRLRSQMEASFNKPLNVGINKGLAAVGSVLGADQIRRYSDEWTNAGNMLKAATAATGMQTRSLKDLRAGADSARVSVGDYVDLYARLVRSASGVAKSESEIALATNLVSKAFKAGGASAQEQAAGILQLGQALGSGVLQGDELRSLRENAPIVAKAIADEFGVTVAKLKDLGAEGQLTSDRVFRAIINAQKNIEAQFAVTNAAIGDGMTAVKNAMLQYIGTGGDATGISASLSNGLMILANNFDKVADTGMQVAAVLSGVLVGRALGGMIRTLGQTTASVIQFTRALSAARGAGELVGSFGSLSAAAGPLGAIIGGAVVLAVGKYAIASLEASRTSDKLRGEMERLGLIAPKTAEGLDKASEALDKLSDADRVRKLSEIRGEIERIRNGGGMFGSLFGKGDELDLISAEAMAPLRNAIQNFSMPDIDKDARRSISAMVTDFVNLKISADEVRSKLAAINNTPVSQSVVELSRRLEDSINQLSATQAYAVKMGETFDGAIGSVSQELQTLMVYVREMSEAGLISPQQYQELAKLVEDFSKTGRGADTLRDKLQGIENANPSFDWLHGQFDGLISKMLVVIKTAQDAGTALSMANPTGPDDAKSTRSSVDPYIVQRNKENEAAADFEKNAVRRASLTKTQLDLENKLADVRKRLQDSGVSQPNEDMVRRIAEAELAGDKSRSTEGKKPKSDKATPKSTDQKIDSDIQAVRDRTAALAAEAQMVGLSYEEQEKRRVSLDLEQAALAKLRDEAIKKGQTDLSNIQISAETRGQIDEVAAAYGRQADALRQVQDQQQRVEQASDEFYQSFKSGMIGAITGATSLKDALVGILEKLSEMLLNAAFDALFKPASGGAGGGVFGSIFSGIGSFIGLKNGGPVPAYGGGGRVRGPGGPRDDKVLMWGSNGEFMMNARATQKFLPILEAMNQDRLPAFKEGGGIGVIAPNIAATAIPVPSVPDLSSVTNNNNTTTNNAPVINVSVNGGTGNAEVQAMVAEGVRRGIGQWQSSPNFARAVAGGVSESRKRGYRI